MLLALPVAKKFRLTSRYTLDLERLLLGVGVGLGSLAFFCAIALIIVCCSGDRSKDTDSNYSPAVQKVSAQYYDNDVTIDNWVPSLPRPKIKAGVFDNVIEMEEKKTSADEERGEQRHGAENPAFIPEADYEGDGRNGRLVANGKKGAAADYVYF